ncbi:MULTISPECIES: hypothetical protein [Massilia]|jgi:hypothetical protein|uniref:hypothetical protein n=1 Tax=Massilia TaxID=149698 RepID=UPI0005643F5A|nr:MULTISPECIES: hypothetical protein [Massilia]MDK6076232.1 hypothetical protein [Massilia varians]
MKKTMTPVSRGDVAVGALLGGVAACVGAVALGPVGLVLGAVLGVGVSVERRRQRAALQARIDNPALVEWDVVIERVHVGTLSDAGLAELEKGVLEDWHVYRSQALNLLSTAIRAAQMLAWVVPVALFWAALAAVVNPEAIRTAVSDLQAMTGMASAIAHVTLSAAGILWVVLMAIAVGFYPCLGYVNMFSAETARAVRHRVRVVADGRMMLVPHPAAAVAA